MKLGIGLPNTLVPDLNRGLFLDWCRVADQAGFHSAGVIDQPDYDSWDPLVSLAIAAGVTERIRLVTTVLQLPNRNEILVAKQAAVIDRVSGGRMVLGVAVGGREGDYQVLGMRTRFAKRGRNFERQLRKVRRVWRAAKRATADEGIAGPAPLQKSLPPIWIGGMTERAIKRAVEFGDGFIFPTAGPQVMADMTPKIRGMLDEKKASKYTIAGIAYFALGDDPASALEAGTKSVMRYYRGNLWTEPENLIHHGPVDTIAQTVKAYEEAGLDELILCPTVPDLKQLEILGEEVLPAYRVPAR